MKEIARRLNMSISTVSRALRDKPGVAPATRARVLAEAEAAGYRPTAGARPARVAVLVPWVDVWYYSAVLAGAESVLREHGAEVLVHCVPDSVDRDDFFQDAAAETVDGLIIVSMPIGDDAISRLTTLQLPAVSVSASAPSIPSVRIDDRQAAHRAVNQLIRAGHRRIGLIGTTDPEQRLWAADVDRTAGYHDALTAAGISPAAELEVIAPWGIEGGAEAMEQLLGLETPPTAVFCFSDEVAIGALRTLRRAGLPVPRAMSVIAVDNHPMAELAGLTTIAQPAHRLGAVAADMVLSMIDGENIEDVVLPTQLTVRETISAPMDAS